MNKKLLLSNLCWLTITVAVIAHSCKSTPSTNTSPCPTPTVCTEDDANFLDATFFLEGIERYREHQWAASNNDLKINHGTNGEFQDARACWYSLARLEKMICLTRQKAAEDGIKGELGIRFYYATYPDATMQSVLVPTANAVGGTISSINEVKNVSWHHTLFMVPTRFNEELKLNEDIYMLPSPGRMEPRGNGEISESNVKSFTHPDWDLYMKHQGDPKYKVLVLGAAIPTPTPSSINQGMLCPPTCLGAEESVYNSAAKLTIPK